MKDFIFNLLSSCNDTLLWALKYTKNHFSGPGIHTFFLIQSNGVVLGAKLMLKALTYGNDHFVYLIKLLWHSASKDNLFTICVWLKNNWQNVKSSEERSAIIQTFTEWSMKECNGFINALQGSYGMQTFIMLAYICIIMGIPMCAVLHPDYIMSPAELELFSILYSNPELFHLNDFDQSPLIAQKMQDPFRPIFENYLALKKEEHRKRVFDELTKDDPIKLILFKELFEKPENYKKP
jgi:hypothetical protein